MMQLTGLRAVLEFELRRTWTIPRMTFWCALTAFPPILLWIVLYTNTRFRGSLDPQFITWVLYILVPEIGCLAGLLLWMSPAVQSELESKTWVYLAVRPYGRRVVLLGKYASALLWSMSSALVALSICVPLAKLYQPQIELGRMFIVLLALSLVSCLGRGAAYAVFAVALPQRAMVFSFAYTIIFEYFVGMIPAIINQLTVQFHMRCLLVNWMGFSKDVTTRMFFDEAPSWRHLLALAAYIAIVLPTAILILEQRQFPSSEEG